MINYANSEPLEDTLQDVLAKAQSLQAACRPENAGASHSSILNPTALEKLKTGHAHPGEMLLPETLRILTSEYFAMRVNCFLFFPPDSRAAILFDTGTDAAAVLEILRRENKKLKKILLTHSHGDHVAALPQILEETSASVASYSFSEEKISDGAVLEILGCKIHAHHLPGHAPDSLVYFISDQVPPILVAGDVIFARSIGGVHENHSHAVADILRLLKSLPPETIILPGHGPLSTAQSELLNNPFLAGK